MSRKTQIISPDKALNFIHNTDSFVVLLLNWYVQLFGDGWIFGQRTLPKSRILLEGNVPCSSFQASLLISSDLRFAVANNILHSVSAQLVNLRTCLRE